MTPPFEQSPSLAKLPMLRHGFFGRAGGVSTGEFESLNVSWSVGDDTGLVDSNRALVQQAVGAGPLTILRQIHSTQVQTITHPVEPSSLEGDAMVTEEAGVALAILTADCTPILFADPVAGVIGAAHAGWRGAALGIVGRTLDAMQALGAEVSRIRVAYGPTIYGDNYEVGDKFKADFLALAPMGEAYFHSPEGGRPHFDLPGFIEAQLRAAGVTSVDRVGGCTYAQPDRYFSHRYATHRGTRSGRQIAVIGMTQV
jgi:YfiH family protein